MPSLPEDVYRILYGDGLPTATITRTNFLPIYHEDGKFSHFKKYAGLRYVVACSLCDYVRPCMGRNEAEVVRVAHLGSAHSQQILAGEATYHLTMDMP